MKTPVTAVEFIQYIETNYNQNEQLPVNSLYNILANVSVKKEDGVFARGDRVLVKQDAGFNPGARGIVEFVEPCARKQHSKVWVLRDGASKPVFFLLPELAHETN